MKVSKEVVELALLVNTPEHNILKVIEETSELNEVLVKTLTKRAENQPLVEKIIEELGDTIVRCEILAEQVGRDLVKQRIEAKTNQLLEYYKLKI